MKKLLLSTFFLAFLVSCKSKKDDKAFTTESDKKATTTTETDKPAVELPYTADFSSSWSQDISDADLKMVLMTYKYWETGALPQLMESMADTTTIDRNDGKHFVLNRSDLGTMWNTYRDSLSSVRVKMVGWNKMFSTDKKDAFIVTWYDEYDTFKDGRVDSATYHDINQVKNGKIVWYSQYKRPLK